MMVGIGMVVRIDGVKMSFKGMGYESVSVCDHLNWKEVVTWVHILYYASLVIWNVLFDN